MYSISQPPRLEASWCHSSFSGLITGSYRPVNGVCLRSLRLNMSHKEFSLNAFKGFYSTIYDEKAPFSYNLLAEFSPDLTFAQNDIKLYSLACKSILD